MELKIADAELRAAGTPVKRADDGRGYGLRHAETLLHWTLFFGVTIVRVLRLDQHHESVAARAAASQRPTFGGARSMNRGDKVTWSYMGKSPNHRSNNVSPIALRIDQGGGKRRLFIAFKATPSRSIAFADAWSRSPDRWTAVLLLA